MNKVKKIDNKILRLIVISITVFLLGLILYFTGICDYLEFKTYDNRIITTSKFYSPSEEISFIALDQESIDWGSEVMGWSWPWPREAYGDIVKFMNFGNANAVIFDVLYTEPSIYGIDDDNNFALASSNYGTVVQTMFISGARTRVVSGKSVSVRGVSVWLRLTP